MKTSIKFATGAALLMLGATGAVAQNAEYDFYVVGQGENRMVMSRSGGEPMPILAPDADKNPGDRPADCPNSRFYMSSDDSVAACDDDSIFGMTKPAEGMMMEDGKPFDREAMILMPMESGTSKMGAGGTTGTTTGTTGVPQ